ncbi:TPA: IS3 family transposase, partial [Enterococcus faecium]|nr:IS3 family transposase [Enterococcus faecium]HAP8720441.1 IS3 family transposase [Enterococcus faecium]HAP8723554.1 IS3 family transposase [Enterococcus faecium]HAP8725549.1 IS3 family transposase [Enterococcus faecium]HAP8738592.1 IS3 family transposase [Enterococcus faecium]
MAKYTFELKLKIVHDYLDGKGGSDYLAKKYSIKAPSQVKRWINAYQEFGEEGLVRKRQKKKYSVQFKLDAIELYLTSELSYREVANTLNMNNPNLIASWMRQFREGGIDGLSKTKGCPPILSKKNEPKNKKKSTTKATSKERERIEELEKRVRSLQIENAFLKELRKLRKQEAQQRRMKQSHESSQASEDRFKLVELLETLKFPKATFMYWQKRLDRKNPDQEIEAEMLKIREKHKDYGCLRMTNELRNRGFSINKKKVQRLIKKLGIKVTAYTRKSRRYNSYRGQVGAVAKNRIHRRFYTSICHQKITTDTTEFKYHEADAKGIIRQKKLYLDPFMDMFNSEILSYRISEKPNALAVMEGLEEAVQTTNDCPYRRMFHLDQGWAYQMKAYRNKLKEYKIFQSMSRKGNCLDNSLMENFFGLLKQEIFHGKVYNCFEELKSAIDSYIYYYNNERIKQKLNWQSLVQ